MYDQREQTRREHLLELQAAFGFQTFGLPHYRAAVPWLAEVARQTDKGVVLVQALMGHFRRQGILSTMPARRLAQSNRWLTVKRMNETDLISMVKDDLRDSSSLNWSSASTLLWLSLWFLACQYAPQASITVLYFFSIR